MGSPPKPDPLVRFLLARSVSSLSVAPKEMEGDTVDAFGVLKAPPVLTELASLDFPNENVTDAFGVSDEAPVEAFATPNEKEGFALCSEGFDTGAGDWAGNPESLFVSAAAARDGVVSDLLACSVVPDPKPNEIPEFDVPGWVEFVRSSVVSDPVEELFLDESVPNLTPKEGALSLFLLGAGVTPKRN